RVLAWLSRTVRRVADVAAALWGFMARCACWAASVGSRTYESLRTASTRALGSEAARRFEVSFFRLLLFAVLWPAHAATLHYARKQALEKLAARAGAEVGDGLRSVASALPSLVQRGLLTAERFGGVALESGGLSALSATLTNVSALVLAPSARLVPQLLTYLMSSCVRTLRRWIDERHMDYLAVGGFEMGELRSGPL